MKEYHIHWIPKMMTLSFIKSFISLLLFLNRRIKSIRKNIVLFSFSYTKGLQRMKLFNQLFIVALSTRLEVQVLYPLNQMKTANAETNEWIWGYMKNNVNC